MIEPIELCDQATKVCSDYITRKCVSCKLKELCQDWNKNYNDISKRNIITEKINAIFIKQVANVKPIEVKNIDKKIDIVETKLETKKVIKQEATVEPKKQVSDAIKKLASKKVVVESNELF